MKKLRVTVDGKSFEVMVELPDEPVVAAAPKPAAPSPALVAPAPAAPAPAPKAATGAGDVTSPLSGKIVSIDVQPGQTVAVGAKVATIEAMKMNTYVNAHKAGRVGAIRLNAGDSVEEGGTILVIE